MEWSDSNVWFDHVGFRVKLHYHSLRDIFLQKAYVSARLDPTLSLVFFLLKTGDLVAFDAANSQIQISIEHLSIISFDIFQEACTS